jgi:hypothetical protein
MNEDIIIAEEQEEHKVVREEEPLKEEPDLGNMEDRPMLDEDNLEQLPPEIQALIEGT